MEPEELGRKYGDCVGTITGEGWLLSTASNSCMEEWGDAEAEDKYESSMGWPCNAFGSAESGIWGARVSGAEGDTKAKRRTCSGMGIGSP